MQTCELTAGGSSWVMAGEDFGPADGGTSWVAIAANPYGGSSWARRHVQKLVAALVRRGLRPQVAWRPQERAAVVRSAGCRCVVAAGGDGTVADVINERPVAPLAVLPLGCENLFARQFGFTASAERLARAIDLGRCRRIDLGRAGDRMFSLVVSAGADAEVAHRLAQWRVHEGTPGRVNRLSYAKPILDALRSYPYRRLQLEADGERVEGTHALVFNLPQYGLRLEFAPMARGDDGLLDWVVFERPGIVHLAKYFSSVLLGSWHLRLTDVHHGQARQIRISAAAPVPIQGDGDPAGSTPIELEVVPQALQVIAP